MPATREDLVKIARNVVTGPNRPSYCENPAAFDPHEWVLEAMERAYNVGRIEGIAEAGAAYARGVRDGRRLEHEDTIAAVLT